MKLLGVPQVRPDAVLALVRFLDGFQSEPSEEEVCAWMLPATAIATSPEKVENPTERVKDVRRVAESLGLVSKNGYRLIDAVPKSWEEFGDLLHERLIEGREYDVIDTYASMVVEVELQGTGWLAGSVESISHILADRVKVEDESGETALFNKHRFNAFQAWITAMGLGLPGPDKVATLFPHPAMRLARVLHALDEFKNGKEVRADALLEAIGRRMPYLDHGDRYKAAWFRAKGRPAREVSRVLSQALLDLQRSKVLELRYEGGDRPWARRLADGMPAFAAVRLGGAGR